MIFKSQFESDITQCNVFSLEVERDYRFAMLDREIKKCKGHIITKICAGDIALINFLLQKEFGVCGTTLFVESCLKQSDYVKIPLGTFVNLMQDDENELFRICEDAFAQNNRYANDPVLCKFNLNIHREWIRNSINGYADYNCGYSVGGCLQGFGTLHFRDEYSVIGLFAIDKQHRNKGIGSKILKNLNSVSLQHGRTKIRAATESNNYAALNIYSKHDYLFYDSKVCLYRKAL